MSTVNYASSFRGEPAEARPAAAASPARVPSMLRSLPLTGIPCYVFPMNSSEALETLRRSEADLRARGVRRAAVFGSVARGDSRPDSDGDIMAEADPEA